MPKVPCLPWWPGDFAGDPKVRVMDRHCRGAYRELLDAQWLSGGTLPDSDPDLAELSMLREDWPKYRDRLLEMFPVIVSQKVRRRANPKLLSIWHSVEEKREKAKDAANKRWSNSNDFNGSNANAMRTQCNPEPEPEPEPKHADRTEGAQEGGAYADALRAHVGSVGRSAGLIAELANRASRFDIPEYREWWREVAQRAADGNSLAEFEQLIKYAEDCADPKIRGAKDLGELKRPGAYIAGKLKALGVRLPRKPKA